MAWNRMRTPAAFTWDVLQATEALTWVMAGGSRSPSNRDGVTEA
jgi:hypothetical protein